MSKKDITNTLPFSLLEEIFCETEKNNDLKTMVDIYQKLFELGFGGTNWINEFEFR